MYLEGSSSLSQRVMTEFYHNLSMQALSKSNDSVRLEFIAIVDSDEKEKEQQNMDEIDKAKTEKTVDIKKITPPTVPSEDEIKK